MIRSRRHWSRPARAAALFVALAALGACATAPNQCVPSAGLAPAAIQPSAGEAQLQEAVRLYDGGDYAAVIQKLQASTDVWNDAATVRVSAYKYLAFSYCVTNRRSACKQAFGSLLKIDPNYELRPTEVGHPIWGPLFVQARKELVGAPSTSSATPPASAPHG